MPDILDRLAAALADRYRLLRELGAGGMATVYLAHDVRHDRQVALKVLRPELAAIVGTERFLQEIRTTANLQHPHIVPLHDSGEVGGSVFYVMPYVEGESLRDRLRRERQLPVDDAVRITCEAAAALDYAHRRGVIHRDIKPENILLHDGRVLVADFGISLALSRADVGSRMTETGLSLGTPHYMSPEQASGERALTARTDVYALGATLYEMLTGEPPFTGPTAQVVIAKALTESPSGIRDFRDTVPEHVEAAVLTALRKLPADRFSTAAEFAEALQDEGRRVQTAPRPSAPAIRRGRWTPALMSLGTVAVLAGGVAIGYRLRPVGAPEAAPARVVIPFPAGQLLAQGLYPFDVAPDGSAIVYVADRDGQTQLVLRPLGEFETRVLDGTDGAQLPFFSPDGQWIGFFAHGKLQKVARGGGAPIPLADAAGAALGAAWAADGEIYFSIGGPVMHRVSERGGPAAVIPMTLARPDSLQRGAVQPDSLGDIRWPQVLPDGRHLLVSTRSGIGVLARETGEVRIVHEGSQGRYLPTGHLLYHENEGRVRIVPFDGRRFAVTGGPAPAIETFRGPGSGAAYFAVSRTGTLVYVPGGFRRTLFLVDRDGRETPVAVESRGYRFPRFSPDGRLIAVTVDPRPSQIWLVDPARERAMPLTSDQHNIHAVWSPNGDQLALSRGGVAWLPSRGGPTPASVLAGPLSVRAVYPYAWSRDGRILAEGHGGGRVDIVTLTFGDTAPVPLVATAANERGPRLSPDGRWLAFQSDLSGVNEVYVQPYPGPGPAEVVSVGGGVEPLWSADGRELFYRRGSRIMAVGVRIDSTFETIGAPRELFSGPYDFTQDDNWDVGPDGRFVMVKGDPDVTGRFLVVLNWFAELERQTKTE